MATYVLLHGAYQGGWIWQPSRPACGRRDTRCMRPPWTGAANERISSARASRSGRRRRKLPNCCFMKTCKSCWSGPVQEAWSSARRRSWRGSAWPCCGFVDALALLPGSRWGASSSGRRPVRRRPWRQGPPKRMPHSGCLRSRQRSKPGRSRATPSIPVRPWNAHGVGHVLGAVLARHGDLLYVQCQSPEAHQRRTAERASRPGTNWRRGIIRC